MSGRTGSGRVRSARLSVRPVDGAPALAVLSPRGRTLAVVIADLHVGLGATAQNPFGPPTGSAPELVEDVLGAVRRARARRLWIAGDVKHPIVGAPPWLRPVLFEFFSTLLREGVRPEVVLGNHDVGLARYLPREVAVHPADGVVRGGIGLFHGHRWPARAVLDQPTVVVGHLHPGFRFAPTESAPVRKARCWVRVRYDDGPGVVDRRGAPTPVRELVVLPAFHPLAGTEALNRERPERGRSFLYQRFLARGEARAYLIDGTDLGPVATPSPPSTGGAAARARRAR